MSKPAVAVIHYHLRPGGVTRVIERAVESLVGEADMLVLSGETPARDAPLARISIPFQGLEYSDVRNVPDPGKRIEQLRCTVRERFAREPDLWHIHNHALGKNSFTVQLTRRLAEDGCRLLLQPHDFAEDGRAQNYRLLKEQLGDELNQLLYPSADHVWYAPINGRDQSFLQAIGLPNVHLLPNAVTAHPAGDREAAATKTIVYPARAIRRKNLGEFLLWSLLAPEGYTFQSTLAPQNPKWQACYNEWVAFAEETGLPVEFDAGRRHDFGKLVRNADALITTSIQEGFGLAFLEPWLEGKMLIGRKLPEITADFEAEGLELSSLYSALPVPLAWAGEKVFFQSLEKAMKQSYAAYSKAWNNRFFEEATATLVVDGKVDFGILDEAMQRNVIRHLAEHPDDRKLLPPFRPAPSPALIARNQKVAQERYSPEAYGKRLLGLYRALAATPPGAVSYADAPALLDLFLKPARFNLLRV